MNENQNETGLQVTEEKPASKPSALAVMGARLNVDPIKLHQTLCNTVFKGCSDEEMMALVMVANEYDLNPIVREMYAFPAKGGGIVPIVSVDGWLSIINRQKNLNGLEITDNHDANGELVSCTCTIYHKDREHPTVVTEYYEECRRSTEPWKMKHRMLRHKAIIQGGRVAFGISGIFDEDEAKDVVVNASPEERYKVEEKPKANPFAKAAKVQEAEEVAVPEPEPLTKIHDDSPALHALMKKHKIDETEVIDALYKFGEIEEGTTSLADVNLHAIAGAVAGFESIKKTVLEARKEAA